MNNNFFVSIFSFNFIIHRSMQANNKLCHSIRDLYPQSFYYPSFICFPPVFCFFCFYFNAIFQWRQISLPFFSINFCLVLIVFGCLFACCWLYLCYTNNIYLCFIFIIMFGEERGWYFDGAFKTPTFFFYFPHIHTHKFIFCYHKIWR